MEGSRSFCIAIVPRGDGRPYPIYDRLALHLRSSFAELGMDVPIARRMIDLTGRPVVLGAHRVLEHRVYFLPDDAICFNLEHLTRGSRDMRAYAHFLMGYEVWDFSRRNLGILRALGHRRARLFGFGFRDDQRRIPKLEETIDVLFYGRVDQRRKRVLAELEHAGVRLEVVEGAFGTTLDDAMARSKIALNIHRRPWHSLEILRVGDLLANERFVVSERGADPRLEEPFARGIAFAPYERLASTCLHFLDRESDRRRIARRGAAAFRKMSQVDWLRRVLAPPTSPPERGEEGPCIPPPDAPGGIGP